MKLNRTILALAFVFSLCGEHFALAQGRGVGRSASTGKGRDGGNLTKAQILNYLSEDKATKQVPLKQFIKEYIDWSMSDASSLRGSDSFERFQGYVRAGLKNDIDASPYAPLAIGPCFDRDGNPQMGATERKRGAKICYSVQLISAATNANLDYLIGLGIHEHVHHFGDPDEDNQIMADVALDAAKFLANKYPDALVPPPSLKHVAQGTKTIAFERCQEGKPVCMQAYKSTRSDKQHATVLMPIASESKSETDRCESGMFPIYKVYHFTDGTTDSSLYTSVSASFSWVHARDTNLNLQKAKALCEGTMRPQTVHCGADSYETWLGQKKIFKTQIYKITTNYLRSHYPSGDKEPYGEAMTSGDPMVHYTLDQCNRLFMDPPPPGGFGPAPPMPTAAARKSSPPSQGEDFAKDKLQNRLDKNWN